MQSYQRAIAALGQNMDIANKARRYRDRQLSTSQWMCASLLTINGILLGTGATASAGMISPARIFIFVPLAILSLSGMSLMIHSLWLLEAIERVHAEYFEWAETIDKQKHEEENKRKDTAHKNYYSAKAIIIKREFFGVLVVVFLEAVCMICMVFVN